MIDYGTIAGFSIYHTARGRDVSTYLDADVEAAKLIASEWIDARYRALFDGTKVGKRDQVREWPRTGAMDIDGYSIGAVAIPTEVENATHEATLKQLVNPGSLSVDWVPPKYKRASVDGAVSVDFVMFDSATDAQTRFKIVDEILAPILTGHNNSSALSGATYRT